MIRTEIHDDVAVILWDLADRPVNVMSAAGCAAFTEAIEAVIANPAIKGAVIASTKRDFIVGADLDEVMADRSAHKLYGFSRDGQLMLRRLENCGKPFVAALNGSALGGGFEVALACHRRIASRNPGAIFGLPEVTLGLLPGAGGTQRLPRMIGLRKALPLMLEGTRLGVEQGHELGIFDEIVDPDQLMASSIAWIRASRPEDAVRPWDRKGFRLPGGDINPVSAYAIFGLETARMRAKTKGNYPAPLDILASVYEGCQSDIDSGLKAEASHFAACGSSIVSRNLTQMSFFAVGRATKLAARPKAAPKSEFKTIGVVGTEPSAGSIARAVLKAGLDVVLCNPAQDQEASAAVENPALRLTGSFDDLSFCDVVIDAGEDGPSAALSDGRLGKSVGAGTLIASSSWRELGSQTGLPEGVIGLCFAGSPEQARLVELVCAGDEATAKAFDFVKRIRKVPLLVGDSPGRYVGRMTCAYVAEGLLLLGEGVKPALIENVARQAGMPKGPLAIADALSLPLLRSRLAAAGPHYAKAVSVIDRVEEAWQRPSVSRKAFYQKGEEGLSLWPEARDHFAAVQQPDAETVRTRLLSIQALEAVRCLEQKVVASAEDADVGALLGLGFPSYLGGPISMIHGADPGADPGRGIEAFAASCAKLAEAHGERFAACPLLTEMKEEGRRFYAV